MKFANEKKMVGWGKGTLLTNYLKAHPKDHRLTYIVDSFQKEESEYSGVPVKTLASLKADLPSVVPVIFPVNNRSRREVRQILNSMGLIYGSGYIDHTDLFRERFESKCFEFLGRSLNSENYDLSRSHDNNSYVPVETTMCGSWLLLECLEDTAKVPGHIVEIGAYRGGNAVLMLQTMAMRKDPRRYFILDSFEGFPELHKNDPLATQKVYNQEYNLLEIHDRFGMFKNAEIIRGFVPGTFCQLPENSKYSMVFFDCDLYEPAVATLEYFWDKVSPGGYIMLHDYIHPIYGGVTKAVDEFCAKKGIKPFIFFENTMACFKK